MSAYFWLWEEQRGSIYVNIGGIKLHPNKNTVNPTTCHRYPLSSFRGLKYSFRCLDLSQQKDKEKVNELMLHSSLSSSGSRVENHLSLAGTMFHCENIQRIFTCLSGSDNETKIWSGALSFMYWGSTQSVFIYVTVFLINVMNCFAHFMCLNEAVLKGNNNNTKAYVVWKAHREIRLPSSGGKLYLHPKTD